VLLRFDVGTLASSFTSSEVQRARLIFYLPKVSVPGELTVHKVMTHWTEDPAGSVAPPSVHSPFATVPTHAAVAKQFVIVDVTSQVRSWLDTPEGDFGFALQSTGTGSALVGAKEGPGSGYPAVLEIDTAETIDDAFLSPGFNAGKLGSGTVDNVEFGHLDGVTSSIQLQISEMGVNVSALAVSVQPKLLEHEGSIAELTAAISALEATASGKVSKAGDSMSGPLTLPTNGLTVGGSQLVTKDGKVGIGTAGPGAALDVRGDVKLGAGGEVFATAGEENLRVVRGTVLYSYSSSQGYSTTLAAGRGFTPAPTPDGSFTIRFHPPFTSPATICVTLEPTSGATITTGITSVTASGATIKADARLITASFHIIAIGPR
jgi:hypothetical protein